MRGKNFACKSKFHRKNNWLFAGSGGEYFEVQTAAEGTMMIKKRYLFLLAIYILGLCAVVSAKNVQTASDAVYRVTIKESTPKVAFVEVQMPVADGHIFMNPFGADDQPNGWGTFVEGLEIRDTKGTMLTAVTEPNASWRIADKYSGVVKLSYKVNLSFVYENWSAGNEQAGRYQDKSLFLVARPLFIVSTVDGKKQITFDLPAGWKVASPWLQVANSRSTFEAANQTDLLSNTMVLGEFTEHRFKKGPVDFTLALPGKMGEASNMIVPTLDKVLTAYTKLFDKTPKTKYLMTFFYDVQDDGEAYSRSAAFTSRDKVERNGLIIWGNFLAHEFFHFWNGQQMRGEPRETREWFNEGFSEYFANLTLVREGLISEELFIKKMEKHIALYMYFKAGAPFQGTSIKQSGTRKSFNRPGVYNGGWAVAFGLDQLIREKTNGQKRIDDFIRKMYEKYGAKPYRYENIVETASEVAGSDTADFFNKYVEGAELLPVSSYLNKLGVEMYDKGYAGEVYLFKSKVVKPSERKLWLDLIGPGRY